MSEILLTQYSGAILGPIAKFLGWIMNGIYTLVYNVTGIENISISIILLTIIIYACLTPLTYKQQKFSKLSQKMNPEIQAVQKRYKDKKDQVSMQRMQEETQAIYEKYGVSPTGSCIQMLIQMPILFALYRVFYNVPAYISSVKNIFVNPLGGQSTGIVDAITSSAGYQDLMTNFIGSVKGLNTVGANFTGSDQGVINNYIVDTLYKLNNDGWATFTSKEYFPDLSNIAATVSEKIDHVNNFLGLSISHTPWNYITETFNSIKAVDATGTIVLLGVMALMIPVLSYLTQLLNIKLMPQAAAGDNDQMAAQMKTMNLMMPLMSLFICFTVPVGLGIYWIGSALVRTFQQIVINKRIEKIDLDDIIKKNQEKAKKKREKMGISENQIINNAKLSTRSVGAMSNDISTEERDDMLTKSAEIKSGARKDSLAAKANLVKDFNERNNK